MSRLPRLVPLTAAAVLALTLSACGSDDSDSDNSSDDSSESSDDESSDDESSDDESSDDSDNADGADSDVDIPDAETEPGAELQLGDTALVPYEYGGEEGTIAITVTEIEEGEASDIADVDGVTDELPYYIYFEVTGVDNAEALSSMNLDLDGFDADANPSAPLISYSGGFGDCDGETAPSDWDGDTYETCSAVALSTPVVAAFFRDSDTYSYYDGNEIVWSE